VTNEYQPSRKRVGSRSIVTPLLTLALLSVVCASCVDPTEGTATAVLHNDTNVVLTVQHCAETCNDVADKGIVRPGGKYETNMSSDGIDEPYVVFGLPGMPLACLHANYKGKPGAREQFQLSRAFPISKKRACG
jgi:hypothetical protein